MAKPPFLPFLLFVASALLSTSCSAVPRKMVAFYELKKGDFSVKVTNWGAIITSVVLPDSKGLRNLGDVVLAYDGLAPYLVRSISLFSSLNLVQALIYATPTCDLSRETANPSDILSGHRGFSHVIWTVKEKVDGEFPYITLYYHSFDGEQGMYDIITISSKGFPGALDVFVTYEISAPYELSIAMRAKSLNKATPVNLAQHSYWNLGGHGSGTILSNTVQIFASKITPVDANLIPTGAFMPVSGTPYDFLKPMTVGSRIDKVPPGYDINYVLDQPIGSNGMRKVAVVKDGDGSGRAFELWANQPGVQFYTGNFLNDVKGKGGHIYGIHAGLCLETQGFPDSVNHPKFPSQIVNPGEDYKHNMLFKFSF
ncbi:hypothetical protein B296_00055807 [Ensete ventricosum]|uniref:Aldose 1-epimerase n=1 Tax=Ensete ventricosum TaxID=4639 RepID=A0A426XJG1_ENSVE|nr:hypothetical protein B296_00055807 [Ensete ventricosum]